MKHLSAAQQLPIIIKMTPFCPNTGCYNWPQGVCSALLQFTLKKKTQTGNKASHRHVTQGLTNLSTVFILLVSKAPQEWGRVCGGFAGGEIRHEPEV